MTARPAAVGPGAGCAGPEAPGVLGLAEARQRILDAIAPLEGTEQVAVRSALGRVLAEPLVSPMDVPPHRNSAMDGYALHHGELPAAGTRDLEVVGTAWAGRPWQGAVGPGQGVRVLTGAKMPAGTDTVIMQEQVDALDHATIRLGAGHRPGQNVRQPGEDVARGAVVLAEGKRLLAAELGLLASLGRGEVTVRRRPRVAFFSTGDELRGVGEPLGEGEIYDSNRYTLYGMLDRLGVEPVDLGVVRDAPAALREALTGAARAADVVLTSGGVSVGEADHVKAVLEEVGAVGFWKIAMKPGRPLAYGRVGDAHFFGLPGNPVAVMATFYQLVQPALCKLMGMSGPFTPPSFRLPCRVPVRHRPGRTELLRGRLLREPDGTLAVEPTPSQGSGILRSMSEADCFIVLAAEDGGLAAGDLAEVQLLPGSI